MAGSRTLKLSILADVDDLKKKLNTGASEVEGFSGKVEKFGKVAAAAFAAATAAAAAYATKLAIDGVKAAIEDEAAQQRLAKALVNVTGATDKQIAAVEDQIKALSLAFGVADDKLRPAFQRLTVATGDVTKSNQLLKLALDISAATGKDVEAVSNALGKAYEGNTGALGRLGVGLSSAEIKSMGLETATQKLAQTFGGAAQTQANTFQGQIARLQVTFKETQETIGYALLPIVQKLLDFIVNTAIPNFIAFKDKAVQPIIDAFNRNRESLTSLYNFIKDYVIPIFINGLGKALEFIGKVAGTVLDVIGKVVSGIQAAVTIAINAINSIIRAYNAIPILPNIPTIPTPSASSSSSGGGSSSSTLPRVTLPTVPTPTISTPTPTVTPSPTPTPSVPPVSTNVPTISTWDPAAVRRGEDAAMASLGITAQSRFDPSGARQFDNRDIVINVNAPSVIDQEGFSRAVVDALNQSQDRGTGGGGGLRSSQVV